MSTSSELLLRGRQQGEGPDLSALMVTSWKAHPRPRGQRRRETVGTEAGSQSRWRWAEVTRRLRRGSRSARSGPARRPAGPRDAHPGEDCDRRTVAVPFPCSLRRVDETEVPESRQGAPAGERSGHRAPEMGPPRETARQTSTAGAGGQGSWGHAVAVDEADRRRVVDQPGGHPAAPPPVADGVIEVLVDEARREPDPRRSPRGPRPRRWCRCRWDRRAAAVAVVGAIEEDEEVAVDVAWPRRAPVAVLPALRPGRLPQSHPSAASGGEASRSGIADRSSSRAGPRTSTEARVGRSIYASSPLRGGLGGEDSCRERSRDAGRSAPARMSCSSSSDEAPTARAAAFSESFVGRREPRSHSHHVTRDTPARLAAASWVRFARSRRERRRSKVIVGYP